MRFNKPELNSLASNPATRFDKEGLLIIIDRQEGFLWRSSEGKPPHGHLHWHSVAPFPIPISHHLQSPPGTWLMHTPYMYILPPTVRVERWCKLRGNLLFYLKDKDPKSAVAGLLVLENCRPRIQNEEPEPEGYVFDLGEWLTLKNPSS